MTDPEPDRFVQDAPMMEVLPDGRVVPVGQPDDEEPEPVDTGSPGG